MEAPIDRKPGWEKPPNVGRKAHCRPEEEENKLEGGAGGGHTTVTDRGLFHRVVRTKKGYMKGYCENNIPSSQV